MNWPAQLPPKAPDCGDDLAMAGGMIKIPLDAFVGAPLANLQRLAAWLRIAPAGPWATDAQQRHDFVSALMKHQKYMAKAPRAKRWDLPTD
jgi:hypothetical protein